MSRPWHALSIVAVVALFGVSAFSIASARGGRAGELSKRLPGRIVEGEVEVPANGEVFENGTLHIRVENITRQDAPSVLVAELIVPNISFQGRDFARYPYALGRFNPKQGMRYGLQVHLDSNSDGNKSPGDYFGHQHDIFNGDQPNVIPLKIGSP